MVVFRHRETHITVCKNTKAVFLQFLMMKFWCEVIKAWLSITGNYSVFQPFRQKDKQNNEDSRCAYPKKSMQDIKWSEKFTCHQWKSPTILARFKIRGRFFSCSLLTHRHNTLKRFTDHSGDSPSQMAKHFHPQTWARAVLIEVFQTEMNNYAAFFKIIFWITFHVFRRQHFLGCMEVYSAVASAGMLWIEWLHKKKKK